MSQNNPRMPHNRLRTPVTPPQFQNQPTAPINMPQAPQNWNQPPFQPPVYIPPFKPARKRRVFLWVFLFIQLIFLIWLITGIAGTSNTGAEAHTQAVQFCSSPDNWHYLYGSQADCITHYGNALNGASDAGKTIGAAFIVIVWVIIDFFVGLGYLIYKLGSRR